MISRFQDCSKEKQCTCRWDACLVLQRPQLAQWLTLTAGPNKKRPAKGQDAADAGTGFGQQPHCHGVNLVQLQRTGPQSAS